MHDRSAAWAASLAAFALLEAAAIVATRSVLLALAGGVLLGGCAGNLASVALWASVPDPIGAGGVYLSLGDALIAAGLLLLVPAVAAFALRNRGRLRAPVSR